MGLTEHFETKVKALSDQITLFTFSWRKSGRARGPGRHKSRIVIEIWGDKGAKKKMFLRVLGLG